MLCCSDDEEVIVARQNNIGSNHSKSVNIVPALDAIVLLTAYNTISIDDGNIMYVCKS